VGSPLIAGTAPESVTVDSSGRFAYVANAESNNISVYTIDQTTGALTAVGTPVAAGTNPISVVTTGAIQ
jgi:6-phosphogluconolactonase (cycloisomerase 2 family)